MVRKGRNVCVFVSVIDCFRNKLVFFNWTVRLVNAPFFQFRAKINGCGFGQQPAYWKKPWHALLLRHETLYEADKTKFKKSKTYISISLVRGMINYYLLNLHVSISLARRIVNYYLLIIISSSKSQQNQNLRFVRKFFFVFPALCHVSWHHNKACQGFLPYLAGIGSVLKRTLIARLKTHDFFHLSRKLD